jgi:hypothetical protein
MDHGMTDQPRHSGRRIALLMALGVAAACALAASLPTSASAGSRPNSFMTGFSDSVYDDPSVGNLWFGRAVKAGAQFVMVSASWQDIAPGRPAAGSDPTRPGNPAYKWGSLDQTVRQATAHGLTVVFSVASLGAPPWATGPHAPAGVLPGTWRPNAKAFGQFCRALARRYSGSFNPGTGVLPRVRYFEAWSEPNLSYHLTPQWVRVGHHWVPESADTYRNLLNAAYAGIKAVRRSNKVIAGATAPFGDPPGKGPRVPPATFVREMLCLQGKRLARERCPHPAHFDILSHHPYEIAGPFWPAIGDNVMLPDFSRLTRSLAVAERDGTAVPRGRKSVWATEYSWNSYPPARGAPRLSKWERWMQESFFVLWQQGVSAGAWFLISDQSPPFQGWDAESGLYFVGGRSKPGAVRAFSFPFVAEPTRHHRHLIWGISPRTGTVRVQIRRSGRWHGLRRFRVRAHGVFDAITDPPAHAALRAVIGLETSLTWHVG